MRLPHRRCSQRSHLAHQPLDQHCQTKVTFCLVCYPYRLLLSEARNLRHTALLIIQSKCLSPSPAMSSPAKSPSPEEGDAVAEHELWTSGDVSLISSDKVRFRVASLTLAWSSPIFADMLALPGDQTDKTIRLSDFFERQDVIAVYLDLVSLNFERLSVFYKPHVRWRSLLTKLTTFLDKYESERGLKLLRSFGTEAAAMQRFSKMGDIVFASLVNDLALCYGILVTSNRSSRAERKPLGSMEGPWQLSLAHQSYETACAIPFPFQWAIARAAELEDRVANPLMGSR